MTRKFTFFSYWMSNSPSGTRVRDRTIEHTNTNIQVTLFCVCLILCVKEARTYNTNTPY